MKKIPFYKYQGAGNDFVILDQREQQYLKKEDQEMIARICDRRFGVGADGVMFLEKAEAYDFRMVYFNADGREGSMCGNGGRCIVAFAQHLGIIEEDCHFIAIDGPHEAKITRADWIELKMQDVGVIEEGDDFFVLDTGSPHYIQFVADVKEIPVVEAGRSVRYSERFAKDGINVNFVASQENQLDIATYERGVEDETLACGTGVTAAAIAYHKKSAVVGDASFKLKAKGGNLEVRLAEDDGKYTNIWLCGPAKFVFNGMFVPD